MRMPFSGMDPYLEHPALWHGVHTRLMVALATQLKPLIRPRYVASVEERVYLEGGEQQRIPDVLIQQTQKDLAISSSPAALMDTPGVVELDALEVRERFVTILDRHQNMRVVAVMEVVSPSNKVAGPGRKSYRAKQNETLASEAHLIEIDLLRRGRHVLAVPKGQVQALADYRYLACVNRWPQRKRFEIYPRGLRDPLPRIRVPLAENDPDVPLDIQAALEQVYDDGDFSLRVRYDQPCKPSLKAADQQWANERWAAYKAANPDLFASQAN